MVRLLANSAFFASFTLQQELIKHHQVRKPLLSQLCLSKHEKGNLTERMYIQEETNF